MGSVAVSVAVVALAGCGFRGVDSTVVGMGDAPVGDWLAGFRYRKPIRLTPPNTTTLADFPVGIIEAADPELAASARGDGGDLVFTAADAITPLPYEIASYAGGALEAWVRLASITPSTPTTIYLYYGGAPVAADPAVVWSPLFAGVWHLSEGGEVARDSTSHRHDLAPPSVSARPGTATGVASTAHDHDGADDAGEVADPADGSLDFPTTSFSYAVWVNETSALDQYDTPFYKGGTSSGQPGYCMLLGTGTWEAKIHDGAVFHDAELGLETALTGQWVHLVATVDRAASTFAAYTNGALAQQVTISVKSLASPNKLAIGSPGTSGFHGRIDEVRIYAGVLSADWIATEHANLATPTGFFAIGAQQTAPRVESVP